MRPEVLNVRIARIKERSNAMLIAAMFAIAGFGIYGAVIGDTVLPVAAAVTNFALLVAEVVLIIREMRREMRLFRKQEEGTT
jgi:hypothetical protein